MLQICLLYWLCIQNPGNDSFTDELMRRGFERHPEGKSQDELAMPFRFLKKTASIDFVPEGIHWFIFKPKKDEDYDFFWMMEAGKKNKTRIGFILLAKDLSDLRKAADLDLGHLAEVENLVYLRISWTRETEKRIQELSKIKSLLYLEISASGNLRDIGLIKLGDLNSLKLLSISWHGFRLSTEKGNLDSSFVNSLKGLVYLRLQGGIYNLDKIQFENLGKLEYLHLEEGDNPWVIFEKMKGSKIKHLSFSSKMWPDDFFEILNNNFPNLKGLSLRSSESPVFPVIQEHYFRNLVYLNLCGAVNYFPNEKELGKLAHLKNLEFLHLGSTKIKKETFEKLESLQKLKILILANDCFANGLLKENDLERSELWKNCKIVIWP